MDDPNALLQLGMAKQLRHLKQRRSDSSGSGT